MDLSRIVLTDEERDILANANARYLQRTRELWAQREWGTLNVILPDDFADSRAASGQWSAVTRFLAEERDPHRLAFAHFELGMHYFHDRDMRHFFTRLDLDAMDEAVRELEEAAALDPNNVEIRHELVGMNTLSGRARGDEAVRHALAELAIAPQHMTSFNERPDFYLSRVDLRYLLRFAEAYTAARVVRELRAILQTHPGHVHAARELAALDDPFLLPPRFTPS